MDILPALERIIHSKLHEEERVRGSGKGPVTGKTVSREEGFLRGLNRVKLEVQGGDAAECIFADRPQ